MATDPRPRAIFLNSPHNPTGGVATREDLAAIADVVRGTELMVFSDEPYCHMVWSGRHASILAEPGMLEHTVAAYTFSKSYSMSGWRIGFAVAAPVVVDAIGKLINTTASCSPPLAQRAAQAALEHDAATRDDYMRRFRAQGRAALRRPRRIDGFRVVPPGRHLLRLPRCPRGLQPPGNHLARSGALPARSGRRPLRRRLPGRRMLRRSRPRLPALQLRRARRAHRRGRGIPPQGPGTTGSNQELPGRRILNMYSVRPIRSDDILHDSAENALDSRLHPHRGAGQSRRSSRNGSFLPERCLVSSDDLEGGSVPTGGARVQIRAGHTVTYDLDSARAIRFIHVAGVLTFAADRDTRLDVGLLKIEQGENASEDGFDCDAHAMQVDPVMPRPALLVGTPERPIEAEWKATIRLVWFEDMDRQTCPALVCCGGRMEIHGAPMSRTWVKLGQTAKKGDARCSWPRRSRDGGWETMSSSRRLRRTTTGGNGAP